MASGIEFLNRIDELLHERNLSRKDFADMMNIPPTTMSNWKTADRIPSADMLLKLSEELKVSIDWLITGKEISYTEEYRKGFKDGFNACKKEIIKLNYENFINSSFKF